MEGSMDTKKKILLVEDDEMLSQVYRSRFEIEGFDVKEVIMAKMHFRLQSALSQILFY